MNPSGLIAGQPVADARCFGSVVYRGICYLVGQYFLDHQFLGF